MSSHVDLLSVAELGEYRGKHCSEFPTKNSEIPIRISEMVEILSSNQAQHETHIKINRTTRTFV